MPTQLLKLSAKARTPITLCGPSRSAPHSLVAAAAAAAHRHHQPPRCRSQLPSALRPCRSRLLRHGHNWPGGRPRKATTRPRIPWWCVLALPAPCPLCGQSFNNGRAPNCTIKCRVPQRRRRIQMRTASMTQPTCLPTPRETQRRRWSRHSSPTCPVSSRPSSLIPSSSQSHQHHQQHYQQHHQ